MRLAARRLGRRHRLAASIAAVAAMVVVVLFAFGEIIGAQEDRRVTLLLCSHPGASRDFDGSLLSGSGNRDVISTHATVGSFRGAANEGSLQSNLTWGTFNYVRALIDVPPDTVTSLYEDPFPAGTTIPCTLNVEYRINNCVAIAQEGPCVPAGLDQDGMVIRDENNRPLVSVRVWLNNTRNPDHEQIPCDPDGNYALPGQTGPVPFQRPPGLTTPISGGDGGNVNTPVNDDSGTDDDETNGDTPEEDVTDNGEKGSDDIDDETNGDTPEEDDIDNGEKGTDDIDDETNGDTPEQDDTGSGENGTDDDDQTNGDTPVEDNTNNGDTSTDDEDSSDTPDEDDTDNGETPTEKDKDSQGTSDAVNGGTSEDEKAGQSDTEVTQTDDSDDQAKQDDDQQQEQEQSVSEQSTSVKESDDAEDLLQAEDQSQAEDAQDLMEQEEPADSEADAEQAESEDEEAQDTEQVQTSPRAPSTGTGGLIESQRETRWRLVMLASMGAAALIAAILIGLNRRNSRSIE